MFQRTKIATRRLQLSRSVFKNEANELITITKGYYEGTVLYLRFEVLCAMSLFLRKMNKEKQA
ncbi:hypothetical protein A0H81_03648 [Grifola frondosa]|uniref:Uncharacterized protein n=1 Tax=Grifola frondosa TaxID=5627 RepID=A0A1C7MHI8_GRIFR|nr:hypothetical protein A0H81_03648 [Grifola frondosa]